MTAVEVAALVTAFAVQLCAGVWLGLRVGNAAYRAREAAEDAEMATEALDVRVTELTRVQAEVHALKQQQHGHDADLAKLFGGRPDLKRYGRTKET